MTAIDFGPIAEGSWTAKLVAWCLGASLGDGGERAHLDIELDGDGWWTIDAYSFYDGYAADVRARSLEAAAEEALDRLTGHPERQREAEVEGAARAVARVANVPEAMARGWLDHLIDAAKPAGPVPLSVDPGRAKSAEKSLEDDRMTGLT